MPESQEAEVQEVMDQVDIAVQSAVSEAMYSENNQRAWIRRLGESISQVMNAADPKEECRSPMTARLLLERDNAVISMYQRLTRVCRTDISQEV